MLLHSHYPEALPIADITTSLKAKNGGSVRNKLREMRTQKLLHGDARDGCRLTQAGHAAAVGEITALA
jgi:hypothetical protein